MKQNIQIALISFILCMFATYAYSKPLITVKTLKGEAKVTVLEGMAQAFCPAQKKIIYLKIEDILKAGCEVSTGEKSRLELTLPDNSIIRFAENTKFKLLQAHVDDTGRDVEISVTMGKIWSNVRKFLGGKGRFEVSCENAVAGVRGTIYGMDVEADKSAVVKVYDGEVSVAGVKKSPNHLSPIVSGAPKTVSGPKVIAGPKPVSLEEWVYIVKSMQQIHIKSDGKAEEPKAFTKEEDRDSWVDWNKARDNRK